MALPASSAQPADLEPLSSGLCCIDTVDGAAFTGPTWGVGGVNHADTQPDGGNRIPRNGDSLGIAVFFAEAVSVAATTPLA